MKLKHREEVEVEEAVAEATVNLEDLWSVSGARKKAMECVNAPSQITDQLLLADGVIRKAILWETALNLTPEFSKNNPSKKWNTQLKITLFAQRISVKQ